MADPLDNIQGDALIARSPFAEQEVREYRYPDPLEKDAVDRFDNKLVIPEEINEGHWIKLRIPRSRGDVNAVGDMTQSLTDIGGTAGFTLRQQIVAGNRGVFELLCEGWSFTDRAPTADDYDRLDTWAGEWVTAAVADAMARGTNPGWAEKNGTSSAKPKASRKGSTSASSRG